MGPWPVGCEPEHVVGLSSCIRQDELVIYDPRGSERQVDAQLTIGREVMPESERRRGAVGR